jgi:DNA-binding beta-propeller fold protein YncE
MTVQRACGIIAAAAVLAMLAGAGPAFAGIVQLAPPFGCLSATDARCVRVHDASAAGDFILSPDGRNAYSSDNRQVLVFDRDPLTGHLTQKAGRAGCVKNAPDTATCAGSARQLDWARAVAISPDGETLYVASPINDVVLVFDRDTATGTLTQKPGNAGCIAEDVPECRAARALADLRDIALSPDGRNLYATSYGHLAVTALTVGDDGSLTQTPDGGGSFGCVAATAEAGCATSPALDYISTVAVTTDGRNVLVGADNDQAVVSLSRDASTGGIAFRSCVSANPATGCTRVPELNRIRDLVSGPASNRIYVSTDYRLLVLDRAPNGTLKRHPGVTGCVSDFARANCSTGRGVDWGRLAISPDGKHLYASQAAVTEHRILPDGGIAQRPGTRGCISPDWLDRRPIAGCAQAAGMATPAALAVAPDGRFVYVSDAWVQRGFPYLDPPPPAYYQVFRRYPSNVVCGRSTVMVARRSRTTLKVPCSDADRNPFTTTIITPPKLGSLGAIDQSAHTVLYAAPERRTGTTTFTFRSAYGDQRSGVGSMKVIVMAKPKRIRGVRLSIGYRAFRHRTVLTKLRVRGVPRGAKVRAACSYKGRRCVGRARKTFTKRHARGSVNLGRRFVGVRLKVGSRITVLVMRPGTIGAAKLVTIRSRHAPKVTTRCLRVGSSTPRKRC